MSTKIIESSCEHAQPINFSSNQEIGKVLVINV